jgi:hypothetical protein
MDVTDVAPSRLRRAKRTAERGREAEGVRLGLVVFAGEAFIALPRTQDRDAVLTYLRALDSDTISVRGSELARGLDAAARAFDPSSSRPRTVLLLTDGEHFGPAPDTQIAALASLGAHVVAVGYGTEVGGAVPGQLALAEAVRRGEATVSPGRRSLRRIASETGGAYFREIEERPRLPTCRRRRARVRRPSRSDDRPAPAVAAAARSPARRALALGQSGIRVRRRRARRRLAAATLAGVALAGTAFGPFSGWLEQGDAALEAGRPDEALALYREAERARGSDARTQIRIGNALFRLERVEQAASAYLEALRALRLTTSRRASPRASTWQHAGRAKHYERRATPTGPRCRGAFERRGEVQYEWAVERILEIPPVPETEPSRRTARPESPQPSPTGDAPGRGEPQPASGGLDEGEAQAWLETPRSQARGAQRQVTNELAAGRARGRAARRGERRAGCDWLARVRGCARRARARARGGGRADREQVFVHEQACSRSSCATRATPARAGSPRPSTASGPSALARAVCRPTSTACRARSSAARCSRPAPASS